MDRSTNRIARRLSKKDSEPSDQFPKDFERIFNESERCGKNAEVLNGSEILVRALAEEGVKARLRLSGWEAS